MLPRDSIYCEALFSPQDIYYEGSEDEDYDDAEARRQRYEAAGQQFLAGRVPMLLSATLKGPFEEESGWVNPWRSKNRTAHLQHQPESQSAVSQYGLRRATPSASASPAARRQAIEILKNAECALPSPESLKQAPFTEAHLEMLGTGDDIDDVNAHDNTLATESHSREEELPFSEPLRLSRVTMPPPKSSALRSLSPRNGRINSRLAPNKIAQPYNSSPVKSSAAVDKALYLQEEDSQQSKENVESMETKENPLPQTMKTNLPISRPNLSEIATDYTCKADCAKADKAQEELMARDAVAPSTTSLVSHLPIEAASPTEMSTAQSNVVLNTQDSEEPSLAQEEVSANSQPALPMEENAGLDIPETPTTRDTSEKATNTELTAVLADDHSQTRQQEQENQILTPTEASESLVIPPQSIDTQQPSSEDLPPPTEPVSKRQSTPEPQFAFTSFSSFMSPSPSHRRQIRYSSDKTYNGVASTSHGILVSSKNRAWRSTTPKKRVSWAPLPHEETDGSGDKVSSETDTSSSLSRGRDRAVSPPPPPSTSLASDSLTDRDMKFGDHFAAVADRSKGTQLQSVPTASGHGSCSLGRQAPVTARGEGGAKVASSGWDDDNEPTDIVQDIFNEMDDFLQVWDVDAELDEARKAEKAQAAASKKKVETLSEFDMDMGMGMGMDMTALF
ncbi:hypothetical protein TrVFT333_009615 [Trichoderma virens FT-333]|nr:hypothetical protein TrVFT333_009615 [Trichoderma virens FT-333]